MLGYIVDCGVRTVTYNVVDLAANRSDLLVVVVRPALSISACQQSGSMKSKTQSWLGRIHVSVGKQKRYFRMTDRRPVGTNTLSDG